MSDRPGRLWYLYLIECQDGSIYTGITIDVNARYLLHSRGKGGRYTRSHPPRRLLTSFTFNDRTAAAKAEYAIKRLAPSQKKQVCEAETLELIGLGNSIPSATELTRP